MPVIAVLETFEGAWRLHKEIKAARGRLERLECVALKSGVGNPSRAVEDPVGELAVELADLKGLLAKSEDEIAPCIKSCRSLIACLDSPSQRAVMESHYIGGKDWEDVAIECGYSLRQVQRFKKAAFDHYDMLVQKSDAMQLKKSCL
jgi:hypothetical protein